MGMIESLEDDLQRADMNDSASTFLKKCSIPSAIFALNVSVFLYFFLIDTGWAWITIPTFFCYFAFFLHLCTWIPTVNAQIIGKQIEADIFVPSRMLVTLLESGNSLVNSFERVSHTKTISGNYFGKIAAEISLGKNLEEAIDDAIKYTPSDSFKRILTPIKNSLRTGAPVEESIQDALDDLTEEKVVEIEQYEKRLAPVSMFYMIFGTILPTIGVVLVSVLLSIVGIKLTFFPFLFGLLFLILLIQVTFYNVFKSIRPLVKV